MTTIYIYIDGNDNTSDLPPILQESIRQELHSQFNLERESLIKEISLLKEETSNSQKAFDLYRERARASIMKASNDQQAMENKVHSILDQLKVIIL